MRSADRPATVSSGPARFFVPGTLTLIPAVWDILSARAAKAAGARALFLAGAGLAASRGLPDGLLTSDQVVDATRDIADATRLPMLVDGEVGYGPLPALARLVERLTMAGAGAILIADQESTLGVGSSISHGKNLCSIDVMAARVREAKSASAGKAEIIARSDL